ncbi:MAG: alpha/beta hydrolase family protein [Candidatus Acidiferrales bacterium]
MSSARAARMSVRIVGAFLFVAAFALATSSLRAQGQVRAECRSVPSKILGHAVRYCAFLPPSYDANSAAKYPVLYYLHGLGGNEQVLLRAGGMNILQDLLDQKKIGEFIILAPDGGRSFYINSRDGKVRYEDFFMREFMPYVESHYRVKAGRGNRGVTGMSMGGYGSLRYGFKYASEFGSVSAHSAAIIEKLPEIEITDEQSEKLALELGGTFGDPIDRGFWQKQSPFTIVKSMPRPVGLQIYFDCGTDDEFGFYKGAQQFHDLLTSRKIPHEFHLYPGGHDWDYFARHFPASLEFHSHAFELAASGK